MAIPGRQEAGWQGVHRSGRCLLHLAPVCPRLARALYEGPPQWCPRRFSVITCDGVLLEALGTNVQPAPTPPSGRCTGAASWKVEGEADALVRAIAWACGGGLADASRRQDRPWDLAALPGTFVPSLLGPRLASRVLLPRGLRALVGPRTLSCFLKHLPLALALGRLPGRSWSGGRTEAGPACCCRAGAGLPVLCVPKREVLQARLKLPAGQRG